MDEDKEKNADTAAAILSLLEQITTDDFDEADRPRAERLGMDASWRERKRLGHKESRRRLKLDPNYKTYNQRMKDDPQFRAKQIERGKRYRENNREILRIKGALRMREWFKQNKSYAHEQRKLYAEKNPEKELRWQIKSDLAREMNIHSSEVPKDLVEARCVQVKIRRLLKETYAQHGRSTRGA